MSKKELVVRLEYEAKTRKAALKDKVPMRNSTWMKYLNDYTNLSVKQTKGELLRSTLFSDGTVHCPRVKYLESLKYKANDIDKGVILTDNEIVHNSEGFVAFLEVDWIDVNRLPNEEEIETYIKTAQDIMKECYPTSETFEIRVCRNFSHVKVKDDVHYFAMGLHLLCPGIVTKTDDNLTVAQFLDYKIATKYPVWSGKTDFAPYHSSNGNLRPCFSRKTKTCPTCDLKSTLEDKPKKKRKATNNNNANEYKNNSSNSLTMQALSCFECTRGKILDTNFYTLRYILDDNGKFYHIASTDYTVLEILQLTTLVTETPQKFSELRRSSDMCKKPDIIEPTKLGLYAPSAFNRLKGRIVNECAESAAYLFVNKIVNRMISKFNPDFAKVVCHKLLVQREGTFKAGVLITTKGVGARYCLLRKAEHSNGHYFLLNRQGVLSFHCHDDDCKAILKTTKIEVILNAKEKEDCHDILHFGGETKLICKDVVKKDVWNSGFYKTELQSQDDLLKCVQALKEP